MLLALKISKKNFRISENSSIIFNFHKKIDEIREERKGPNKIGTTGEELGLHMKIGLEEELFVLPI